MYGQAVASAARSATTTAQTAHLVECFAASAEITDAAAELSAAAVHRRISSSCASPSLTCCSRNQPSTTARDSGCILFSMASSRSLYFPCSATNRSTSSILANRVEAAHGQHVDLEPVRDDLRELAGLSLQCRAGVAAFETSPHYDSAAAQPVANKVLVELREAPLTYLVRVRATERTPGYPEFAQGARKAAAETIEKVVPRVAELAELEAACAARAGAPQDLIGSGLAAPMRKIAREWVGAITEQGSA
jgi:hypothetical protein